KSSSSSSSPSLNSSSAAAAAASLAQNASPPNPVLLSYDRTAHTLIRSYLHTKLPPELTHLILPAVHELEVLHPLYQQVRFNFRTYPPARRTDAGEEIIEEMVRGRVLMGGGMMVDG